MSKPNTEQKPLKLKVEKLQKNSKVSSFNCGRASLDEWLKEYSWQNQASDSSKTYIVKNEQDLVVGYYTLAAGSISIEEVVIRIAKGQPKNRSIPIIKLARLAVDQDTQGMGLGKALLKDALLRCINAADEIAARAVIVDALDDKVRCFYERFDFVSGPDAPNTLMILMKDLRKTFSEIT